VTDQGKAVFLSYASEDAEAALELCKALRAAGIEVWFDQSELRGGDVWDRKIRREIEECALFVPVISANTASRHEGYFRLEWDLADQRTHMMAPSRVFVVPVFLDATTAVAADAPESFRRVQRTRLSQSAKAGAFVENVHRLLSDELTRTQSAPKLAPDRLVTSASAKSVSALSRSNGALLAFIAVAIIALAYLVANRWRFSKHGPEMSALPSITQDASAISFNPPQHSIAVLPFVNLSEDKDQEYFSDGLTEELLNSLAEINELQVAARTSAFSFKGQDNNIATIARKLNVGAILEGSVRRSANTIRVTAQLINTVTGFHLWSKTYDRDLGDVLQLQTEIATSVASALKVTLLGDIAAKIELGGTNNPAAFDAYLRGAKAASSIRDTKDLPAAIAAYTEAIRLDPRYAIALAARSTALSDIAVEEETSAAMAEGYANAQADARQALEIAPQLAQAHLALAYVSDDTLNFSRARDDYERAVSLAPGNAEVLQRSGQFAAYMGHFESGIAAARRAVVLDPLSRKSHTALGQALYASRRYAEALAAFAEVVSLEPDFKGSYAQRGLSFYGLGDLERARTSCETKPDYWVSQLCLAVTYEKLGRRADAETELAKIKSARGDAAAYQYAAIYAQWGLQAKALESLETSWRLRDPGLEYLKTDPLMDPLRREPHFQTIERHLKFPN
jgi:TolB-like protein/Tfp pilus assembly protein PilF